MLLLLLSSNKKQQVKKDDPVETVYGTLRDCTRSLENIPLRMIRNPNQRDKLIEALKPLSKCNNNYTRIDVMVSQKQKVLQWIDRQTFSLSIYFRETMLHASISALELAKIDAERFSEAALRRFWNYFLEKTDNDEKQGSLG